MVVTSGQLTPRSRRRRLGDRCEPEDGVRPHGSFCFEVLIPHRFEARDVTMPGDQGHYPGSLASRNELLHSDGNSGQARGIHAGAHRIDLAD
jgi:hypothetical protein